MMRQQPQVFSVRWFKLHQLTLLWWANTLIGRLVLGIPLRSPRVVKLRPDMCATTRDGVHYTAIIYAGRQYANRLYYAMKPLWCVLHGLDMIGNALQLRYNFGFDTLTKYASAADGAIAGGLLRNVSEEAWATMRAGAGNTVEELGAVIYCGTTSAYFTRLSRGIATFRTDSIAPEGGKPASVVISSASLWLYGHYKNNTFTTAASLDIVSASPASYTSLASDDYLPANVGETAYANVPYANWITENYKEIPLNAAGIAWISPTTKTHTAFCSRIKWDTDNVSTGWESGKATQMTAYTTTADKYAKLVLTYTIAAAPTVTGMEVAAAGVGYVYGKSTLGGNTITGYKLQIASENTFATPDVDSGWVGPATTAGNPLPLVTAWASPTAGTWYARIGIQSIYYDDAYTDPVSFDINFPSITSLTASQDRERCKVTVVVSDDYADPPEVMFTIDGQTYKGTLQ